MQPPGCTPLGVRRVDPNPSCHPLGAYVDLISVLVSVLILVLISVLVMVMVLVLVLILILILILFDSIFLVTV